MPPKTTLHRCLLLLLLCCLAAGARAETRYIGDRIEITLRTGKSTRHEIIRMLPTGAPLELLEDDPESGYARVRTAGGREGWVLRRFLDREPPARTRLAAAQAKVAELELEAQRQGAALEALRGRHGELEQEHRRALEQNGELERQLAEIRRTASSALAIDSENKELKARLMALERMQQTQRQEYEALRDRTARDWFMIGAGVLLLGVLAGVVLPRIRWRRRSGWGSL